MFTKVFCKSRLSCAEMKFITMCGTIRSLKSTYAGSFVFDLHKFCLGFAARKRNIGVRDGGAGGQLPPQKDYKVEKSGKCST